ncbi:hypothetical protein F0P94_00845 [Adhaeribacter soli]|uniref:Uncharacterized protein n=1 Tax=Adhaeribacter soli TaxID=2607655 RepID=A0A5N1J886_9BACT|nr:hypothetical protein F0P94_00845 [Adhaeribacter soli]
MKQPWLHGPVSDGLFVLAPPFLCLLAVLFFPDFFQQANQRVSLEAWVVLVLLIDVGHVYSTLFRTYFDKEALQQHRQLFLWAPLAGLIIGILLYSLGSLIFWRVLAYLAVFHFVRQQYGFMQLYSRREVKTNWEHRIDKGMIYAATLYPLLYWHLEGNRNFNWFIAGDFVVLDLPELLPLMTWGYGILIVLFLVKELRFSLKHKSANIPRNLVVTGTAMSWYLGIVHFNGDLVFTLFNVVSHGIPYMALIWFYGRKKKITDTSTVSGKLLKYTFSTAGLFLFLGIIFGLAFLEEGFWDALVWQEHPEAFSFFQFFPAVKDQAFLTLVVPFLAVPQLTHYILDGFIWKVSRDKNLT